MDFSFLLFVFCVWGEEGWGRQVCFSFLFFCVLLFLFLLGFLMPYKTIGGEEGKTLQCMEIMDSGDKPWDGWKQT
jgi:hypothetical protein